jgi:hypothetical protein
MTPITAHVYIRVDGSDVLNEVGEATIPIAADIDATRDGVGVLRVDLVNLAALLHRVADSIAPTQAELMVDSEAVHDHKPVQHRDGRPPWCNECGLTASFHEPKGRFDRQG